MNTEMKLLQEGNQRFLKGERKQVSLNKYPELSQNGQKPFAIVVACADSRVPVEEIFDVGPGEIFVIRVAGNVVQSSQIASIEYAVANLGTPTCVFMGHTKCGAVQAAVDTHVNKTDLPTQSLKELVALINPAVEKCSNKSDSQAFLSEAIEQNVKQTHARALEMSPLLKESCQKGSLNIVEAVFDIGTGSVKFLG